jgi:hypothetical protein
MSEPTRRQLADFGLTEEELDLWFALAGVAGGFLRLRPVRALPL